MIISKINLYLGTIKQLDDLPNEILERIFTQLNRDAVDSIERTCRRFHYIVQKASDHLNKVRYVRLKYNVKSISEDDFWVEVITKHRGRLRLDYKQDEREKSIFENAVVEEMIEEFNEPLVFRKRLFMIAELCSCDRIPVKNFTVTLSAQSIHLVKEYLEGKF